MKKRYKRTLGLLMVIAIMTTLCAMPASASESGSEIADSLIIGGIELPKIDTTQLEPISMPAPQMQRAPAPKLTDMYVLAVASANIPSWEYVDYNAAIPTTSIGHGGDWIIVATVEIGYTTSSTRKATLAGWSYDETQEEALEDSARVVYGYIRYWIFDYPSIGSFSYTASGLMFPYNSMTARCNIR